MASRPRLLFVVNESYFFWSHRLILGRAAREAGFEVHVAAPPDHVWAPADFQVTALAAEDFHYHAIPLSRRGVNPLSELSTFLALARLYRRLRPALVHHITIKPVLYGGIAARLVGLPAVVSAITGLGQMFVGQDMPTRLLRWAAIRAYRLATAHRNLKIIVQNPDDGARLTASGAVAAGRIVLIPGAGVSLQEFQPTPEAAGPPVVLLAGRLLWEKGVGVFAEAARLLRAKGSPARFVVLGNTTATNPRAVPEADLRRWVADGAIEWWPRRTDMPAVLAGTHVVCLPSAYGEGVPKILIEAAAAGRAIVATDIPGCRDIARDGENALLVPTNRPDLLAEALQRLIGDAGLRGQLGARGRAIAEAEFAEHLVIERTLSLYRSLLDAESLAALAPATAS